MQVRTVSAYRIVIRKRQARSPESHTKGARDPVPERLAVPGDRLLNLDSITPKRPHPIAQTGLPEASCTLANEHVIPEDQVDDDHVPSSTIPQVSILGGGESARVNASRPACSYVSPLSTSVSDTSGFLRGKGSYHKLHY